ncbi:MAG: DUF2344 domain-containing protein, partial [Desulfovibrio sp.]|nr:DUF2344 domain-containing protein [Desulfovibrio sp.]
RRLADVVERAYCKGAIFVSWMDHFSLDPWLEALEECGLDPGTFTGPREPGTPLPWSHLEAGVSEEFLLRERRRALEGKTTSDCRYTVCHQCGACDTKGQPSRLPHVPTGDASHSPLRHANRLVFPQRDQQAHAPSRDDQGRLLCRPQASRPKIPAELTVKAVQYRVWHSKTGGSASLSQLELQAVLERALRRANMPLAFSQGFHPMPLVSFGRALPVGVESLAEWFSLTLHRHMTPQDVMTRLAPRLPHGMSVIRVDRVDKAHRTEQAVAETFALCLANPEDRATARHCFEDFARQNSHMLTRETKKGPRTVDIRPVLRHWTPSVDMGVNGLRDQAVTFVADWSTMYLSPLVFCLAVLAPMGTAEILRPRLALCKTAQIFPDGSTCTPQAPQGKAF